MELLLDVGTILMSCKTTHMCNRKRLVHSTCRCRYQVTLTSFTSIQYKNFAYVCEKESHIRTTNVWTISKPHFYLKTSPRNLQPMSDWRCVVDKKKKFLTTRRQPNVHKKGAINTTVFTCHLLHCSGMNICIDKVSRNIHIASTWPSECWYSNSFLNQLRNYT